MTDKKTEALKLALEALELEDMACRYEKDQTPEHIAKAITAIREALAEQTALLAANKDLQNHFDALMNDYKKLSALCSSQGTRLMEYESSHEPESKPWVGLTDQEIEDLWNHHEPRFDFYSFSCDIEAKLKEKNA